MFLTYLNDDCERFNRVFSSVFSADYCMTCLLSRIQPYFFDKYTLFFNTLDSSTEYDSAFLLKPWAKGPFYFSEFSIDAEWDCSQKWERIKPYLGNSEHSVVFDVGCGNGFYLFELSKLGVKYAFGIDPTFHYYAQYQFLKKVFKPDNVSILPMTLEECPEGIVADKVLCLGVLYHQTDPLMFLKKLRSLLKRKGVLILETLIYPGEESFAVVPNVYYAGMKNIYFLPTKLCLTTWLESAGFAHIEYSDISMTTSDEQRVTSWSRKVSLSYFLDKENPLLTTEGYHRPLRVIAKAVRK